MLVQHSSKGSDAFKDMDSFTPETKSKASDVDETTTTLEHTPLSGALPNLLSHCDGVAESTASDKSKLKAAEIKPVKLLDKLDDSHYSAVWLYQDVTLNKLLESGEIIRLYTQASLIDKQFFEQLQAATLNLQPPEQTTKKLLALLCEQRKIWQEYRVYIESHPEENEWLKTSHLSVNQSPSIRGYRAMHTVLIYSICHRQAELIGHPQCIGEMCHALQFHFKTTNKPLASDEVKCAYQFVSNIDELTDFPFLMRCFSEQLALVRHQGQTKIQTVFNSFRIYLQFFSLWVNSQARHEDPSLISLREKLASEFYIDKDFFRLYEENIVTYLSKNLNKRDIAELLTDCLMFHAFYSIDESGLMLCLQQMYIYLKYVPTNQSILVVLALKELSRRYILPYQESELLQPSPVQHALAAILHCSPLYEGKGSEALEKPKKRMAAFFSWLTSSSLPIFPADLAMLTTPMPPIRKPIEHLSLSEKPIEVKEKGSELDLNWVFDFLSRLAEKTHSLKGFTSAAACKATGPKKEVFDKKSSERLKALFEQARRVLSSQQCNIDTIVSVMEEMKASQSSWLTEFRLCHSEYELFLQESPKDFQLLQTPCARLPKTLTKELTERLLLHFVPLQLVFYGKVHRLLEDRHIKKAALEIRKITPETSSEDFNVSISKVESLLGNGNALIEDILRFRLMMAVCIQEKKGICEAKSAVFEISQVVMKPLEDIYCLLETIQALPKREESEQKLLDDIQLQIQKSTLVTMSFRFLEQLPKLANLPNSLYCRVLLFHLLSSKDMMAQLPLLDKLNAQKDLYHHKYLLFRAVLRSITCHIQKICSNREESHSVIQTLADAKNNNEYLASIISHVEVGWLARHYFLFLSEHLRVEQALEPEWDLVGQLKRFSSQITLIGQVKIKCEQKIQRFREEQQESKEQAQLHPSKSKKTVKQSFTPQTVSYEPLPKKESKVEKVTASEAELREIDARAVSHPLETIRTLNARLDAKKDSPQVVTRLKTAYLEAIKAYLKKSIDEIQNHRNTIERAMQMIQTTMDDRLERFPDSKLFEDSKSAMLALNTPTNRIQKLFKIVGNRIQEITHVDKSARSMEYELTEESVRPFLTQLAPLLSTAKLIDSYIVKREEHANFARMLKGPQPVQDLDEKVLESQQSTHEAFKKGKLYVNRIIPVMEPLNLPKEETKAGEER